MVEVQSCAKKTPLKKLVLFGAGGMGREVAILVGYINSVNPTFDFCGYVVDDEYYQDGHMINGLPMLGTIAWLVEHKDEFCCALCIGDAKARAAVFNRLEGLGIELVTLISPDVYIDPSVNVGAGCIISARCLVSPNVDIGEGVFLNTDVAVGHDTIIKRCATLYPRSQISGNCVIGEAAQVGSCSFLSSGAKIGDGAIVAPLSAVYGKVKANTHVIGNPAHRINL